MSCGAVVCGACCCCCALTAALIGAFVYWLFHLNMPTAGVELISLTGNLQATPPSLDINATLWVNNPNGWPMSGKILDISADVFLLDTRDPHATALRIGEASLAKSLDISEHENSSTFINFHGELSENALTRLTADCSARPFETTIGVNLTGLDFSFWKHSAHVPLDELGSEFTMFNSTVKCPSANAPTTSPTHSPTPTPTQHPNSAACSAHSACAGLKGDCCPTLPEKRMLDCCSSNVRTVLV